jgi:hypothetical protein
MRFNRSTIAIIVVSVVVIVAILVLNGNPAIAPSGTSTPTSEAVPLFTGLDATKVIRYELKDNQTGSQTTVIKSPGGAWQVYSATFNSNRDTDQTAAQNPLNALVALTVTSFAPTNPLSDFGLGNPTNTITLVDNTGKSYTLLIGSKNPGGARYYAILQTGTAPTTLPELTPEATSEATAEATSEATAAAAEKTATVTPSPTATPSKTPEATAVVKPEGTSEATSEATAEATATLTPAVTLAPGGSILLVQSSALDDLIKLIGQPPYIPAPTSTPTSINPFDATATAAVANASATAGAPLTATQSVFATATAKAEATSESTAEATGAPASAQTTPQATAEATQAP